MEKIYPSKYIKICKDCRASFSTKSKIQKFCTDCAARRIKESRRRSNKNRLPQYKKPKAQKKRVKKPDLSISQILKIQKLYNADNKTLLNYGNIVQKIESGEIEIVITKGVIGYVQKD